MNRSERYAAALECVSAVYRALDASDAAAISACFVEDAVWHRPDGALRGIAEIEGMIASRQRDRDTVHIVNNLECRQRPDGHEVRYYLTIFAGTGGVGDFVGVLACEDFLVEKNAELRVAEKRSVPMLLAAKG